MDLADFIQEAVQYASGIRLLELAALVSGLLCVLFLIKQNILTWPAGIIYVLISLVVFVKVKLYADFILHVFYLILNIYGWYYWLSPQNDSDRKLLVTHTKPKTMLALLLFSAAAIFVSGKLLMEYTDASLPYWDSTTSILSISAMWLTAKKKLESWLIWLVVDILATGIYFYKGLHFYCILYLVYIGMAVAGFISWRRSQQLVAMGV